MQPTMKLRYVERPVDRGECIEFALQQWHEGVTHTAEDGEVKEHVYGEWRDVPIEVES